MIPQIVPLAAQMIPLFPENGQIVPQMIPQMIPPLPIFSVGDFCLLTFAAEIKSERCSALKSWPGLAMCGHTSFSDAKSLTLG
jgi:hypothetical protein